MTRLGRVRTTPLVSKTYACSRNHLDLVEDQEGVLPVIRAPVKTVGLVD